MNAFVIFIIITFLVVALAFLFVDAYINLNEWQSRIHIGRWSSRKQWQQAIEKKSCQWIKKSPSVRTSNNTRLLLWDMLTGKYRNKSVQSWQDAGLLLGLGKDVCVEYAASHPDLFKTGFETDHALLAFALDKYGCLTDGQRSIVVNYFKQYTDQGISIPYRKHVEQIRFVDTIGMVVPFLHHVGMDEAAARQVADYDKALLRSVFPAHAYNLGTNLPLGVHDWSRGIGWYIIGLVFSAEIADHRERIVRTADALLPLQQVSGGFACFIFNPAGRMESSGSALIGLLMLKAYELTNDDKFKDCAFRIEKALMSATRRDGSLDYCQSDTMGIGYYSQIFSTMPFAQGMALLLSKELSKYEA